jgi:hypothetical protein
MMWLEPLSVRLAGQAHLDTTIPLIVAKLLEDGGDILNQECAEALTRIGTAAVLEAVAEAFPAAEQHFRLYSSGPLENIHSDLAVERAVQLLAQEKDHSIRRELAHALLCQFAPEGVEVAHRLLLGRELDFEDRGLRNYLLETCTLTGERFPEYDEWLATEKAEKEEHWRRVKELEGDPEGLLLFALEKLTGKKAADVAKAKPPLPPMPRLTLPRKPQTKQKRHQENRNPVVRSAALNLADLCWLLGRLSPGSAEGKDARFASCFSLVQRLPYSFATTTAETRAGRFVRMCNTQSPSRVAWFSSTAIRRSARVTPS